MPDQQSQRESFTKWLQNAMRSPQKNVRVWSRKKYAENTEIHDLGCDATGQNQYLIAADVEGRRLNYRTIALPGSDPQSDAASPTNAVPAQVLSWLLKQQSWDRLTLTNESTIEVPIQVAVDEDSLLDRLSEATGVERRSLICDAETFKFSQPQRDRLRPMLWAYISEYRNSKSSDELVAVGSAIRKYVSMLDITRLDEMGTLLKAGHRAPLSPELQLEVAKMVFRRFEANPPAQPEPQPRLSKQLWDIAQAYLNPHVLLHDKFATVASLCIEAIVAMRSASSQVAVEAAFNTPYSWFSEMVGDNLRRLSQRWRPKNVEAADWCCGLLS